MRFTRLRTLATDESGFSLVFVAVGFMGFFAASMLAIDVGMLMTARSQAQNSADAGALAGATALFYNNWDDRTPTGPAVRNAISAAKGNKVIGADVNVLSSDIEFPNDPTGQPNRVKATVYRDSSRGNPVSTLIAQYFGISTVNVTATATAEASPADTMTCVLPFTIPDRWIEKQTPPFDPDDGFDLYASKNKPLANPDIYIGPDDPATYTGYNAERDKGVLVRLKADNTTKVAPSFYYPYAVPGSTGGSDYRWNIGHCNTTVMQFGQTYDSEPGNMVGPTNQGMDDLIALDPDAYWDPTTNRVISNMQPSPRVRAIPLFDPAYYADGKQNGRNASLKFVNYLGFFIESMQGNEVVGRITPIGGLHRGNGSPAPAAAFPKSIRLVQ
ncbi:MAG TPA: pilus assembly protein TadG-related protein [Vicinamibacterales bacterium]|nr:pilus assembly protein TadG-related protein [Vicinamibacterales bacterium]